MYVFVALLALIISLVITVFIFNRKRKQIVLSNVSEFLCLLKENKIFPIIGNDKWHLDEVRHGVRKWKRTLNSEYQGACMEINASYALINRPFQVVEGVLKNCKTKNQWSGNVPVGCKFRIFSYRSDGNRSEFISSRRRYSMEMEGYTREVVRLEHMQDANLDPDWMAQLRNWVKSKVESIIRSKSFERCWNKSNDKEFWLIENSANFRNFVFYLLNWNEMNGGDATQLASHRGAVVEGRYRNDTSCLLTVLVGKDISFPWNLLNYLRFRTFPMECPTILLAGLNDFLTLDAAGVNQTLHLSEEGDLPAPSTDAHSASGVSDLGFIRRKIPSGKSDERPEVSFFQRIRNMLDDKKDEDGKLRRWSILGGESQDLPKKEPDSPINPIDIIKRFSLSNKFFDEKKTESDASGDSKIQEGKKKRLQPEVNNRSIDEMKFLHKNPLAVSSEFTSDVDEDLLQCLETMVDNAALDIIAEKCKVANLDIKAKSEEQAIQSGGWIYCGLEKDTVILKKISNDDTVPLHSYIGKGMVSHSPKLVYEVLRCPTRRVAYDDMVKNVEILKELEGGLKIVRLLYEIGQHFRRELREFIVLQGERIEGMKHIITLQSIDWNTLSSSLIPNQTSTDSTNPVSVFSPASRRGSLEKGAPSSPLVGLKEGKRLSKVPKQPQLVEGLVSAKMFSSGWIIEPVLKANKLCSMITYISQMKLDTGMRTALSYLAEDIALKQPLCIVHLRHYLATLDAEDELLSSNSDVDCKRGGKSVTLSITNALARFRNHPSSDRPEESDHDIVV